MGVCCLEVGMRGRVAELRDLAFLERYLEERKLSLPQAGASLPRADRFDREIALGFSSEESTSGPSEIVSGPTEITGTFRGASMSST